MEREYFKKEQNDAEVETDFVKIAPEIFVATQMCQTDPLVDEPLFEDAIPIELPFDMSLDLILL